MLDRLAVEGLAKTQPQLFRQINGTISITFVTKFECNRTFFTDKILVYFSFKRRMQMEHIHFIRHTDTKLTECSLLRGFFGRNRRF